MVPWRDRHARAGAYLSTAFTAVLRSRTRNTLEVPMPADVSALRTLSADLRSAGAGVGDRARLVVAKTAHDVEATAKELAPVDTGYLMNSIGTDITGNAASSRAIIGPTAEYAPFLEHGTSRMAPQPFMEPAITQHESAFTAAMESLGVQGL